MTTQRYDLVVLGTGPAGEKGAAQAAYFGKRVAVVEKAPQPGGAAVHTGTLPSKTLRETALYLSGHRTRPLYGLSVKLDDPRESVARLIARKDTIAGLESARMRDNLRRHGVDYVEGYGRFADLHALEVTHADGRVTRLEGEKFLITTGSRPLNPPEIRIDEPDVYDSDEILGLERLPQSLVVLGAGVIGCEYACMFAALGVTVTVVEARDALLPFLDEEMGQRLRAAMERLGITFSLGVKWKRVDRDPERGLFCELVDGRRLWCENLLFAAGRVGATRDLGLERIGLAPDARGYLKVDEHYRTEVPHVYAAGDVIGFPALASTSMEQARVAACHAFGIHYKSDVLGVLPYGIYTIPEVSCVGETEQGCRERHIDHVVGRAFFADNARGQITGDVEGMLKLVVHAPTRRLIGVHVIGERASELVHIGQAVMQLGGSVDVFIDMVFNYPTLSEAYKYAAYAALGALAERAAAGVVQTRSEAQ